MAIEYMSFEDVLAELQIDEEELKKLVSQGELRGFRDGLSMKFKKDDVLNLKQGRETEPTIILTDSDAQLVEVGSDESMETEAFELMEESGETDAAVEVAPVKGRSGRARSQSQSARLRALEIEQKKSHAGMTAGLLFGLLLLALQ